MAAVQVLPDSAPPSLSSSVSEADDSRSDGEIRTGPAATRLPRAASYTYLPSLSTSSTSGSESPSPGPINFSRNAARRKSEDPAKIRIDSFQSLNNTNGEETAYKPPAAAKVRRSFGPVSWSVADSFASLTRKSFVSSSTSRSPSPTSRSPGGPATGDGERLGRPERRSIIGTVSRQAEPTASEASPDTGGVFKSATRSIRSRSIRRSALLRRSRRSPSPSAQTAPSEASSEHASSASLPRSVSFDRLPALNKLFIVDRVSPMPLSIPTSTERLPSQGQEPFRRKDELWTAFRNLDHDYQKFQSKTSALKANVVRTSLLPFLTAHADHPSNRNLRPGDLDKRVMILNKWWTGLLDMLEGGNQTLSGTDRPILLDGIVGIMTRPEWRAPPSAFAPLEKEPAGSSFVNGKRTRSSASLASSTSDFIAESIHHNIRNMFIQNLLAQTAIVVEKLSLKTAPASLVVFGGKAMAYAFFFCPGLAEVLVRIWATPPDSIRRVLKEFDLFDETDIRRTSEHIALAYPECVRGLAFSSFAATVRRLRKRPTLPLSARKINWRGPWTGRWSGRDSDLFFGFVKQWHILSDDFLPADARLRERACAPAFVLVHAQLLTVLDSTILRRPGAPTEVAAAAAAAAAAVTFDDVLADADASAAALPLPASNPSRSMAENRLIMLLRDVLSSRSTVSKEVQHHVADAFVRLLQAAARKVSLFNQNACFTLCDFLEESSTILVRYQKTDATAAELIDWRFWLLVCQQMAESQNTMSELRLFAFLYSVWGLVTVDESRKEALCTEWLLSERTFDTFFTHWCPVIRAYYMRLLCWRVGRCDSEPSRVDFRILNLLADRLASVWANFLEARSLAETNHTAFPSTAPCNPAPGRRLLIVRSDTQVDSNLLASLQGPTSAPRTTSQAKRAAAHRLSDTGPGRSNGRVSSAAAAEAGVESGPKKRWTLLRNIRSFSSPGSGPRTRQGRDSFRSESPPSSGDTSPDESGSGNDGSGRAAPPPVQHSFRFSLEWNDRLYEPGRDRRLYPPQLPMPARQLMQKRRSFSSSSSSSLPSSTDGGSKETSPQSHMGSKYTGRALAEWAHVIGECHGFFVRRKAEGVGSDANVETPTLGMDAFRKS